MAHAGAAGSLMMLGDYQLGAHVERRAMADVYEAIHHPSGGARLVYLLHRSAAHDHPFVHRVICEVDAARWLRHTAIAKVEGHGETPSGGPYVAVVRPAGRTLAQVLATGERVGRRQVVRLANRLVEALDEAHAVGLIHGRLTPASVIVGEGSDDLGMPLLALTGLGVAAIALDGPLGEDERPYVSPEQLAGRDADERSDVFGLASLLHHVLIGSPPAAHAAARSAVAGHPEHPSAAAVLAAARSAEPERRSRSVKAFWEDFVAALIDDAAAEAAPTADAAAAQSGVRTSDAVALQGVIEQLAHQRKHVPSALDAPKPALLSPLPIAPGPWDGLPASSPRAAPLSLFGAEAGIATSGIATSSAIRRSQPVRMDVATAPPPRQSSAVPRGRPIRRQRTGLRVAAWLTVPAAIAVAAGWSYANDAAQQLPADLPVAAAVIVPTADESVSAPPRRRVRKAPQPADTTGARAGEDADSSAALPLLAPIDIPAVAVPAFRPTERFRVTAEDFTAPPTPRDSGR